MSPVDILNEILLGGPPASGKPSGKPSGGPSGGPDLGGIFRDIFGGGPGGGSAPRQQTPSTPAPRDIERDARELEDMFGVGQDKVPSSPPSSGPARPSSQPEDWTLPAPGRKSPSVEWPDAGAATPDTRNTEALVLIRAMIMAAKADGRLTEEEQRAILERVGNAPDATRFLQNEFRATTGVRDFAWSVPLGLENKVYTISLTAIDLDTRAESDYLRELAHGLRLPEEVTSHIHQRFGIRPLSN